MKNTNITPKSTWKIAITILAIATLVLAGTTTFLAVKSKKSDDSSNADIITNPTIRYLTIKEWGVKLVIPNSFKTLTYTFNDGEVSLAASLNSNSGTPADLEEYLRMKVYRSEESSLPLLRPNYVTEADFKLGDYYYFSLLSPYQELITNNEPAGSQDIIKEHIMRALLDEAVHSMMLK